jgi:replicative DNA helicase
VSEVLANNKSKVALDHLINYLAVEWERDPDTIRNWFYSEISTDSATSYQHLFKDIGQARDESQVFLKDDNVIPLGFDVLDQCFPGNGARPGQLFMALGKSGTGKAQPLTSKVLTPTGFKEIGNIGVGDNVIDPSTGDSCNVVGVFPQGEREIYKITFSDGSICRSDGEHLWTVLDESGKTKTITLKEIINSQKISIYQVPSAIIPETPDTKSQILKRRSFESVEKDGVEYAVCIALDSKSQLYLTDDLIPTHNTMLATQILANMAETGVRSVFFSLEQAAKSLFPRLVCQALDVDMEEAERLIKSEEKEDEELLKPVREIYKNMLIIDNVPTESRDALSMTPSRIQAIVQEANLTHFKDKPANVIVIDHLGILDVDDDAPSDVKRSDLMAPGYIMQRLFAIAKATNTLLFVLQQLPKEVPPGKAFGYDAGRGGSKQTDFCDAIFCIWRPEQDIDLDDEARASVSGQYKLALGKNRYGGSAVAHLFFDKASLRIMPPLQIVQPDHINPDGPVIDLEEEVGLQEEGTGNSGDIRSPEEMETLASKTDPIPEDTQQLLDSIGAENVSEDIGDDFDGPDPALQHWFD